MLEIKSILISEIVVPERIRPVDEDHAQVIAASIAADGLINPITIRQTPNAKGGSYTLVAGAHRLRACILNEMTVVDAVIVKADQTAAQVLEISENLFRNDLSVIDRALFVQTLRDLYEQENGKIAPGGDQKAKRQLGALVEGNEPLTFAEHVADRLGVSKRSYGRLNEIAQKLNPALRDALRNTPLADNQAQLLKLAKMQQAEQQRTVIALKQTDSDLKKALELVEGKAPGEKPDPQAVYLSKAIEVVAKMTPETFTRFKAYLADRLKNEVAA